jgi:histidine ammonia-lyase
MTFEALNGQPLALDKRLLRARGFKGAIDCAENLRKMIAGSKMLSGVLGKKKVQDAYSLRSTPQVIGAAKDALKWVRGQFAIELNGVGDNPLFFADKGDFVTGGNFQGTPLAIPLETLGVSLTTVAVLSERRLNRLVNPNLSNGLPAFLIVGGGLMSGLMIAQYTADALITDCRVNCNPAATLSIPAAADQEDFVSMGMTTAIKTRHILGQAFRVIGIELLAAAQALDFRKPHKPGKGTQAAYRAIRKEIAFINEDRPVYIEIEKATELIKSGAVLDAVEKEIGKLK